MSDSLIYERFDAVYVPPMEYHDIEETLLQNRCVIISGTAENGKTFTSVKLLWEIHKMGYKIWYVREGAHNSDDLVTGLTEQRESLRKSVVYFEDPVGQTHYTANRKFEDNILGITGALKGLDVFLIVTMREDIYYKFNPIGKDDLRKFLKRIGIHSYDYDKRKKILRQWASVMNCPWLRDRNFLQIIDKELKGEYNLPTPLNIKDFARETREHDSISDSVQIQKILRDISRRTPERFAREIKEMLDTDRRAEALFLCFPFFSSWFPAGYVKSKYLELVNEVLQVVDDDFIFERVGSTFKDKVEISEYVRYVHASYLGALPLALTDQNDIPTQFNTKIFRNVALKLSKNGMARLDVAKTIADNIELLTDDMKELLINILGREGARKLILINRSQTDTGGLHIDKKTWDILGKEGVFLLGSVTSFKNSDIELASLPDDVEFDWKVVWDYLTELEKRYGIEMVYSFLGSILSISKSKDRKELFFYYDLLQKVTDAEICTYVLQRRRSFQDIVYHFSEDEVLKKIIDNHGEAYLRERLKSFIEREYLVEWTQDYFKATQHLALSEMPRRRISFDTKLLGHIELVAGRLNSLWIRDSASEIVGLVQDHFITESPKSRSVAAGILYHVMRPLNSNAASIIQSILGVNPVTTYKYAGRIRKILNKHDG
jgi:hypothetical protein